tara:strand:- start:953 stop:1213 length:261 start_codon:yes stop_codon:yes gene_type:complete
MVKKLTLGIVVKIQLKNKNIYRQLSENFQTTWTTYQYALLLFFSIHFLPCTWVKRNQNAAANKNQQKRRLLKICEKKKKKQALSEL